MALPIRLLRYAIAFAAAVAVTYVLAAVFYSELVVAELATVGVTTPLSAHVAHAWDNIVGLANSVFGAIFATYFGVIVVGLAMAYAAAAAVKSVLKPLAPL